MPSPWSARTRSGCSASAVWNSAMATGKSPRRRARSPRDCAVAHPVSTTTTASAAALNGSYSTARPRSDPARPRLRQDGERPRAPERGGLSGPRPRLQREAREAGGGRARLWLVHHPRLGRHHPRFAREHLFAVLVHADGLQANAVAVADDLDDLDAGGDAIAALHRLHELERLRQVDRAGPRQLRADDGGDEAGGEDAGRDGRLERRRRGVGGIAMHGVVVADGVDEGRDVAVLDDARELGVIARREVRDRLADHFGSLWSRRWRIAPSVSSMCSSRSSSSTICFATAVSWVRDARLSTCKAWSICCSAAFFIGAFATSHWSRYFPIIWA